MKNKSFTYLLVFLLMLVWGGIVYRIIGNSNTESENIPPPFKESELTELTTDTFKLLLNYEDPFSIQKIKRAPSTNSKKSTKKKTSKEPPKYIWPSIKYNGIIKNNTSFKQSFIISISGNEHLVSIGDSINDFVLKSGNEDRIEIVYGNNKKYIEK